MTSKNSPIILELRPYYFFSRSTQLIMIYLSGMPPGKDHKHGNPEKKKNDVWVKDDDWDGSLKKKKVNRLRHVESKEPATSSDNKP